MKLASGAVQFNELVARLKSGPSRFPVEAKTFGQPAAYQPLPPCPQRHTPVYR